MSFRYTGGLLTTASPVNAQYPSGVWTQQQSAIYQAQGLFATDPNFRYTSLLLNGNGTNGAQNNTFLDSSTNNFTITRNGNTTQGAFTPYVPNGWWSNYFNGSSYLTVPSSSAFKPASSDFTIEAWVFVSNTGVLQTVYGDCDSGTNNGMCELSVSSTLKVEVDYFTSSTAVVTKLTTGSIQANAWNHICVSKTGTTMYIGYNGTLETFTGVPSTMQSPATLYPALGRLGAYAGYYINGYISNFRFVVGSAVYTGSTYTVPISPLTAISGTSLLTCQSNRFIDNSSNSFAITTGGSSSVQQFQPFPRTVAYSATGTGGSGYFDGSGDYLSAANATALQLSGSQFTIEGWFYLTVGSTDNNELVCQSSGSADANVNYQIRVTSTNKLRFLVMSGASPTYIDSTTTITTNSWHHFACVCDGSGAGAFLRMWVDGVYQTASSSFNASGINTNTAATQIGAWTFSSQYVTGYISDFRILKGTALYTGTSNITVPTAPLTAITNTSLLLSYTNAGIFDNALSGDLETVGNAQVSTSVVKYGTGSMYFDGTSSSLPTYSNLQNFQFAAGNFTVECWVNKTANGTNAYDCVVGLGSTINATEGWYLEVSTSRGIYFVINNTSVSFATWANDGVWHHIAVTRSSGTLYIFKDGVLLTSGSLTTSVPTTATAARIGNYYNGSTNYYYSGYIDDLRITKGLARYTASFTPPIAPFPKQ